jgi:flagellar protein FliO/FliZ
VQIHDVLFTIGMLAGVLGLIWLVQRGVRKSGFARPCPAGRLRLVQSLTLDSRRRVILLDCDGRTLMLLTGGPNDLLLTSGPAVTASVASA